MQMRTTMLGLRPDMVPNDEMKASVSTGDSTCWCCLLGLEYCLDGSKRQYNTGLERKHMICKAVLKKRAVDCKSKGFRKGLLQRNDWDCDLHIPEYPRYTWSWQHRSPTFRTTTALNSTIATENKRRRSQFAIIVDPVPVLSRRFQSRCCWGSVWKLMFVQDIDNIEADSGARGQHQLGRIWRSTR
jgi:hypothetical protein